MRSSSTPQGTSQPQHRGQMQNARGSWHGRQFGAPWQLVGPLSACMTLCTCCVCGNVPTFQLICVESGPLAQGLLSAASPAVGRAVAGLGLAFSCPSTAGLGWARGHVAAQPWGWSTVLSVRCRILYPCRP